MDEAGPMQSAALSCPAMGAGGLVLGVPAEIWGWERGVEVDPGLTGRLFAIDTMPNVIWRL